MSKTTYHRVRYQCEDKGKTKTVILMDMTEPTLLGHDFVFGTLVNKEGDEITAPGVSIKKQFIDKKLVRKITPLKMNPKYCELENA